MNPLKLYIDTQELRQVVPVIAATLTSTKNDYMQWDFGRSTSGYVGSGSVTVSSSGFMDNVTHTLILKPLPWTNQWSTSSAGLYARTTKSDYNIASNPSWVEKHRKFTGDIYLYSTSESVANTEVITNTYFTKNKGQFLSWHSYNSGNDVFLQIKATWRGQSSGDIPIAVWFWSDGTAQVLKNGIILNTYHIGAGTGIDKNLSQDSGSLKDTLPSGPINVALLPGRKRELICFSNQGGGFSHVFDDIDKDDPNPTITPPGPFSWQVMSGQADVQHAPLRFEENGVFFTLPFAFREPPRPEQGSPTITVYYDNPYYNTTPTLTTTLVNEAGTSAFTANSSAVIARIKVVVSSDGTNTPFIYGASVKYDALGQYTYSANTPISGWATTFELSVPDSHNGVQARTEIINYPSASGSIPKATRVNNRPFQAYVGSNRIFTGRTQSPRYTEQRDSKGSTIEWTINDLWSKLEATRILDPIPFDGQIIEEVITDLLLSAGVSEAEMDLETTNFRLPSQGQSSKGDWALIPEAGDTVAYWLDRLHNDYASTFIMGFYPGSGDVMRFRFRNPDTMGTTPSYTLYDGEATTLSVLGSAYANRHDLHFCSFEEDTLPPEANQVIVGGYDSRTETIFTSFLEDSISKDPTLAPSGRPNNWLGEPVRVAIFDPAITRISESSYVASLIYSKVSVAMPIAQFSTKLTLLLKTDGSPIWRGDVVRLYGRGLYRIMTMYMRSIVENSQNVLRDCVYVGRYIGAG